MVWVARKTGSSGRQSGNNIGNLGSLNVCPKRSMYCLGGGFKYVLFLPLLGEMIQFD